MDNIFSLNTLSIIVIILLVLTIINIAAVITNIIIYMKDKKKYNKIWQKFNNKDLENDIKTIIDTMEKTTLDCESVKSYCSEIKGKMTKCLQKVGFVKYDAYETGNNGLSFVMALLDDKDDGILINSVYNRNYSNIYAKEVSNGEVKGNISKEEQKVLEHALNDKSFM